MTQLWAIQTKLGKEDSTLQLVDAFHKLGLNWAAFPVVPFDHHVPDLRWGDQGPIVYYGSTGLIQKVWSDPELAEGAALYWSPGTHATAYYGPKLGSEWLNHGAEATTIGEFFLGRKKDGQRYFIRPDSGGKPFAGQVWTAAEFGDFAARGFGNGQFDANMRIVVNEPVEIVHEYRTWWIGGTVADVVGYRDGHRIAPWHPFDTERAEIFRYSEEQGAKLADLEAFVLDVARLPDGTLKVVEINDIHAAGFYSPEVILDVVGDLSNYVAKHWRK